MSSADFTANNNNPTDSTAGRGQRARTSTAAIEQHNEAEKKKAQSRACHQARAPQTAMAAGFPLFSGPVAPGFQPFANGYHYLFPQNSEQQFYQNQQYGQMAATHTSSSPNPFFPSTPFAPHDINWQRALMKNQLYAFPNDTSESTSAVMLEPDDMDEVYADGDADLPDDANGTAAQGLPDGEGEQLVPAPQVGGPQDGAVEQSSNTLLGPSITGRGQDSPSTPKNLRIFPQATTNMSAADIQLAPPRPRLVRRVRNPNSMDLSSPGASIGSSPSVASKTTAGATPCLPLVHRTNIFGPGLHDPRHRPRQSPQYDAPATKENADLTDDEPVDAAPPKKKSRKQPTARSIVNVDPKRRPIIEKAYDYISLHVLTKQDKTWLNGRPRLVVFVQEAFNWAVDRLGLNTNDFDPVTELEQDLCRERIYMTRKDLKDFGRVIAAGPDGFGFLPCSTKAGKEEQDRIAAANRKLVAELTDRFAFDPHDRTVKGTMYKHASISVLVNAAVFANLLAPGLQYPEFFDDTPLPPAGTELEHTPTQSLVTIALILTALRSVIMEHSSGHFLPEDFSRKVYKPHFDAELNTLREWRKFTSNPTVIPGDGPVRTIPATFLTRDLQQKLFAEGRYNVLKDVVAPLPSSEAMDTSDFALNQ
ncbi:hypothetical protein K438DRAFT_1961957 [Mycena galopus ATCC 62051]|nr:hypothetical protein K438DRAFT_1961957 [Mycena galopus ATCC 62051]